MSSAPNISLIPPARPDLPWWDRVWSGAWVDGSGDLPDALALSASSVVIVLLAWLVVLTSVLIWVRYHRHKPDQARPGYWHLIRRTPEEIAADTACNWQVAASRMTSGQQKWTCQTCGQDGFSTTREPPAICAWTIPEEAERA